MRKANTPPVKFIHRRRLLALPHRSQYNASLPDNNGLAKEYGPTTASIAVPAKPCVLQGNISAPICRCLAAPDEVIE
jgi:hypothetical protein